VIRTQTEEALFIASCPKWAAGIEWEENKEWFIMRECESRKVSVLELINNVATSCGNGGGKNTTTLYVM